MKRKGKRRKPMDKGTVQQLCFVLGLLLFGALFMVSVTSWYVHEYRGERFFATGRLESVAFDIAGTGNYVLELGVNGERYEIMRPSNEFQVLPYDFGVEGDKALDAMHALGKRACGATSAGRRTSSTSSLKTGSWD